MRGRLSRWLLPSTALALLAGCATDWRPAFDERAEREDGDTVAIADIDQALTFARVDSNGGRRVIAVTRYASGTVEGVDLTAALGSAAEDPIPLFLDRGYDALRDAIRRVAPAMRVAVPAAELGIPVDLRDHHIAAGTNFPEHAGDAGTTRPFLFAKLVRPTRPTDPVSAGVGLLDYEVELAFVPLEPVAEGVPPGSLGLILCNDFTDRETLMYALDSNDIESGKGFTTGKSFPGYLPVGNLFVIPRDVRAFAAGLELRLYVNDGLRQRASATEMVWDIDEILAQAWARRDVRWDHRGQQVSLWGESDVIPARTLIMTGTPHGTVFSGVPTSHMLAGVSRWLFGGWGESIPRRVIDVYVEDARAARAYLQPGDRVLIRVNQLGVIRNDIAA